MNSKAIETKTETKTQKRCVVCRKAPVKPNYLLPIHFYAPFYKDDFVRNVCRKCAVKIQEELIKDSIKRKQKVKTEKWSEEEKN